MVNTKIVSLTWPTNVKNINTNSNRLPLLQNSMECATTYAKLKLICRATNISLMSIELPITSFDVARTDSDVEESSLREVCTINYDGGCNFRSKKQETTKYQTWIER